MTVGTGAISLSEVLTEVTGESTQSLVGAIGAANSSGYNPTYYTAPATSLAEFRGYNDNPVNVSVSPTNLFFSRFSGNQNVSVTVSGGTTAWTASDNQSWINLSGTTSSSSSGTTTVNVTQNFGSSRFGTVTWTWSGTNRTCTVIQGT